MDDMSEWWQTLNPLDVANLVLGLTCVWLLVRRNIWGFPLGIIASLNQGLLFFRETFYADAALQGFFIVLLIWGWYHWLHPKAGAKELPITRLTGRNWVILLIAVGVATAACALIAMHWTDSKMPWRDAFIAAGGVAGQWLQSSKRLDNWPVWVVVNSVAGVSYWLAGMQFTGCLYLVYLGMAVIGWRQWRRALAMQDEAKTQLG